MLKTFEHGKSASSRSGMLLPRRVLRDTYKDEFVMVGIRSIVRVVMLNARIFSRSSLLESVSACMDGATQLPQGVSFTLSRFMRPCGVTEGLVVLGHCIREWLVYYKVYFLYSV